MRSVKFDGRTYAPMSDGRLVVGEDRAQGWWRSRVLERYIRALLEQGNRERVALQRAARRRSDVREILTRVWPGWVRWRKPTQCGMCSLWHDGYLECKETCLAWRR